MHARASTPPPTWNRALVWSEHDTWMTRRHAHRAVLVCLAFVAMMVTSELALYAVNQQATRAVAPQAVLPAATTSAPIAEPRPCCSAPSIAWVCPW